MRTLYLVLQKTIRPHLIRTAKGTILYKKTFEKLYAIPEDEVPLNNGCIKKFLGPVNEHLIVTGSKLNEAEKDSIAAQKLN